MKKIYFLLLVFITIFFIGCTNDTTTNETLSNSNEKLKTETNAINLEQIMANAKNEIPTVQETKILTEDNDPYGNLGKTGYYISGAVFWDTRTNYSEEHITENEKGKWGSSAGGMIEVYSIEEEAQKRIDYMQNFVGNPLLDPGAFKKIGAIVIRASNELTASEQNEIINFLEKQVTNK